MAEENPERKNSEHHVRVSDSSSDLSSKEVVQLIGKWLKFLKSKSIVILLAGIVGGALGLCYSFYKKPVYTASSTFVLEESGSKGGSLGQYAGLASMIGIDLGGGGGIFQGDNLLELYQSRTMIQKTLLSKIDIDGKQDSLINLYVKFNQLREKWNKDPKLKVVNFNLNKTQVFSRTQDSLINTVVKDIKDNCLNVTKPDKKLSIIKVEVKSKNEIFSKYFNDQIVKNVNDFYVQSKTKKSLENLTILQNQTDSIRQALNGAISGIANSIDANPNANLSRQVLRVPSQRRQIDAEANRGILTELVKTLEMSKVSLRQETPLIQVIDQPFFPLEVSKFGKLKGIVLGGFLLSFLTILFLILSKIYKEIIND